MLKRGFYEGLQKLQLHLTYFLLGLTSTPVKACLLLVIQVFIQEKSYFKLSDIDFCFPYLCFCVENAGVMKVFVKNVGMMRYDAG